MTEQKLGDFLDELEGLLSKYRVRITSLCDSDSGSPHACFRERGTEDYYNIDNEADDLEIGAKLNFD